MLSQVSTHQDSEGVGGHSGSRCGCWKAEERNVGRGQSKKEPRGGLNMLGPREVELFGGVSLLE